MRRGKQSATNHYCLPSSSEASCGLLCWGQPTATSCLRECSPVRVVYCPTYLRRPSICLCQATDSFRGSPDGLPTFSWCPERKINHVETKKGTLKKKKNSIAPTYIQGRKFYIKFLWFKDRSQTTDPNSSWSEVKARSAKKKISNWYNCSQKSYQPQSK